MSNSTINFQKSVLNFNFLKTTGSIVKDASLSYIKSALPTTSENISETRQTFEEGKEFLKNTTSSILPKVRELKKQFRTHGISKWFQQQSDEFSSMDNDENLKYDIPTDDAGSIETNTISEADRNTNRLGKAMVQSIGKLTESQMISTANIEVSLDKQTAEIKTGFKSVTSRLDDLIKLVTENSSVLIETNAKLLEQTVQNGTSSKIEQNERNPLTEMLSNGKFSLSSYKDIIKSNISNDMTLNMAGTMIGLIKDMFGPGGNGMNIQDIISAKLVEVFDKKNPKVKENLQALDQAVSNTVMDALIRLGEKQSFMGGNLFAKIFGINAARQDVDTSRSTLELKSIPFDTVTKESITNAIPGYLRRILKELGGKDIVYDYTSRSFVTKRQMDRSFREKTMQMDQLSQAGRSVQQTISNDDFSKMTYDLLLNDLGAKHGPGGEARSIISNFKDVDATKEYLFNSLFGGSLHNQKDIDALDRFAKQLANLPEGYGPEDIFMQAARLNKQNQKNKEDFVTQAENMSMDLSYIKDSAENDANFIREQYGRKDLNPKKTKFQLDENPEAGSVIHLGGEVEDPYSKERGFDYTNRALYAIFKRLDKGINVFRTGKARIRDNPYEELGSEYLKPPKAFKPKNVNDINQINPSNDSEYESSMNTHTYEDPFDENETNEDGTPLTRGQKFAKWGKKRGGQFKQAIFNGNASDVTNVFKDTIQDITKVSGEAVKEGASKINTAFGNLTGSLRHKLTGEAYSYQDGVDNQGNPIIHYVKANEKKGIAGYITENVKDFYQDSKGKVTKWFKDVAGYFDYGDKNTKNDVKSKRKKLLATSIGAFAGFGLMGAPMGALIGGLAGNAIGTSDIGTKIKDFLFGHDLATGKPTGLLNKAVDHIISPIEYQIGKTVTYAGSAIKKHIFGPLSDIGVSIRDRIHNHVDSIFDNAKKKVKKVGKKVVGGIGKGLLKGAELVGTAGRRIGTTAAGKAARATIGVVTAPVGAMTRGMAKHIAGGNSFHKLKDDESYPLLVGEKYRDPSDDGKVKVLGENDPGVMEIPALETAISGPVYGIWLNGTRPKEFQPRTKEYLKWRKKLRNIEIKNDKARSGFYTKGGIKGFFGGDYKSWHEQKLLNRQNRRNQLGSYTEERELSKEEIEAMKAEQEMADTTAEIAKDVTTIVGEIIPGSSFKTHDQGIHDRLDQIIQLMGGRKDLPSNVPQVNPTASIDKPKVDSTLDSSLLQTAATISTSDENFDQMETNTTKEMAEEAAKKHPESKGMLAKFKTLISRSEGHKDEKEEKKSFLSTIVDTVKGGFGNILGKLSPIALAVAGIIGFKDLKSLWTDVIKGDMDFSEWWGEESTIGKGVRGLMQVSEFSGKAASLVVKPVNSAIRAVTKILPGIPEISPPEVDPSIPFGGLANTMLAGLYLKGINAVISGAGAIVNLGKGTTSTVTNLASKAGSLLATSTGKSTVLGKVASTATSFALPALAAYTISKGGLKHENTDASGDKIVDQGTTRAATLNVTRGVGKTIFGIRDAVDPLYAKGYVKRKATDRMIDAAQAAAKHGDDAVEAATRALERESTKRGVKSSSVMSKRKVSKIVEKATKEVGEEAGNSTLLAKVVNKLKTVLTKLFESMKKHKSFKKLSGIANKIDDIAGSILKFMNVDAFKPFKDKVAKIAGKNATKDVGGAATAGIGYAVFGIAGGISGYNTAANIFQVKESDVDGTMRLIATVLVAALNGLPGVGYLELVDLVLEPMTGKTLRQHICQGLYSWIKGNGVLEEKQSELNAAKDRYNTKYGTNLSTAEYNDMTNDTLWGKIKHGKAKIDKNGDALTDEAGKIIHTGGITGIFAGQEKKYAKDKNGNLIKDKNGNVVQAVDKWGNKLKKDEKWGDVITKGLHGAKGFLFGQDEYETDKDGNVKYDKGGNPIVKKKGKNVIVRQWDSTVEKAKNIGKGISSAYNKFTSLFTKVTKDANDAVNEVEKDDSLKDKDGKEIKGKIGTTAQVVKRKGFKDFLMASIRNVTSSILNPINEMNEATNEVNKQTSTNKSSFVSNAWNFAKNTASGIWNRTKSLFHIGNPEDDYQLADAGTGLPMGSPLNKKTSVTSGYGPRNQMGGGFHKGVDLIPSDGSKNADVSSQYSGTVVGVKNSVSDSDHGYPYHGKNSGGNFVKIQTDSGDIVSNYHLKAGSIPSDIQPGSRVNPGTKIGSMGNTGNSTGEHLHYQIDRPTKNGKLIPLNPFKRMGDPEDKKKDSKKKGTKKASTKSKKKAKKKTSSNFELWIGIIKDIKKQIASAGRGYSWGGNNMTLTSNGFTISTRTDCSGFVQACVSCYAKKNILFNSGAIVGDFPQLAQAGFTRMDWPGWEGLYQGDIITSQSHVEIFSHRTNGQNFVWNCGSNTSCNSADPTPSSKPSYPTIWRHNDADGSVADGYVSSDGSVTSSGEGGGSTINTEQGPVAGLISALGNLGTKFLNDITGGLFGTTQEEEAGSEGGSSASGDASAAANVGPEVSDLWKYFRSLGYSDNTISGALGCWTKESNNNPKRVEWDTSDTFKNTLGYDKIVDDRSATDQFTQALFAQYARQGLSINQNGYKASDGHYYPGIGYAQWTGDRAKRLLDFARSNNLDWYKGSTQLAYLDNEFKGPYATAKANVEATTTPEEAARIFARDFEGYSGDGVPARQQTARELYSQYAGKYDENSFNGDKKEKKKGKKKKGKGGPDFVDESSFNLVPDSLQIGDPTSSTVSYDLPMGDPTPIQTKAKNRNTRKNTVSTSTPSPMNLIQEIQKMKSDSTPEEHRKSTEIKEVGNSETNQQLVSLLKQAVSILTQISGNTGSSNTLLEELNEKDFVDQGLRDSIQSLSKIPKKQQYNYHSNSTTSIAAMARP